MLTYSQAANPTDRVSRDIDHVLAHGRTHYQEYLFFRSQAHGVCVALDGDIQSCESDEAIYHEALAHPALLIHPRPRKVLIMGGGEGATAREALRHDCVERVVMVDIDREFVDLCRELIPGWSAGVYDDPRLEVHYEDINEYLERTGERFDVVIGDLVDVQDWDAPAGDLYSRDFYAALTGCMRDGGVFASQAGALSTVDMDNHNRIRARIAKSLPRVRSYGLVVPSFYHMWSFVLGSAAPLDCGGASLAECFDERVGGRGVGLPATGSGTLAGAFLLPRLLADALKG